MAIDGPLTPREQDALALLGCYAVRLNRAECAQEEMASQLDVEQSRAEELQAAIDAWGTVENNPADPSSDVKRKAVRETLLELAQEIPF